ncbi:MAG: type IV pili methyl-accepting chemotaxis transducer N-terminal domain-containing protein [Halanaeroarchaeum sp.]
MANAGGVYLLVQAQEHDGAAIDMAGRQRMLTQQMTKYALQVAAGDDGQRAPLEESAAAFDRSLRTLRFGDESAGIPSAPPRVADQLAEVNRTWAAFERDVRVVATAPQDSERFQRALNDLVASNERLLAQSDLAVQYYEAEFQETVSAIERFLGLTVVLDFIALAVVFSEFSRRVVAPVRTLTDDAIAVARGDTRRDLTVFAGADEVGQASRALNAMQTTLQEALGNTRKFETAVANAGNGIFITDDEGVIEYVNPAFERITGYDADVAVGMSLADLFEGSPAQSAVSDLVDAVADGETRRSELLNQRPTGERYYVEQTITPIEREDGTIDRFVGIAVDVTEERRREQLIDVQNRVLRHNLRSGTNVIDGYTTLLAQQATETGLVSATESLSSIAGDLDDLDPDGGEANEALQDAIEDNVVDIDEVTDRMVELAETIHRQSEEFESLSRKAELAERVIDRDSSTDGPVDAAALLRTVCAKVEREYPGAHLSCAVPETATLQDASGLDVALFELVENGIKHSDEETPSVSVTAVRTAGGLVVDIEDEGPGIPQYERQVLDVGRQTPLEHASGLGLWIAYWVVTGLGGTMTIEENQPRGTRVRLDLPLATPSQPA